MQARAEGRVPMGGVSAGPDGPPTPFLTAPATLTCDVPLSYKPDRAFGKKNAAIEVPRLIPARGEDAPWDCIRA